MLFKQEIIIIHSLILRCILTNLYNRNNTYYNDSYTLGCQSVINIKNRSGLEARAEENNDNATFPAYALN